MRCSDSGSGRATPPGIPCLRTLLGGLLLAGLLLQAVPAAAQYVPYAPYAPYAPYQTAPLPPAGAAQPPAGAPVTATEPPPINLTQRGIPAEASAENGVLARDQALAAGRRLAWERALSEAGLPPTTLSDRQIEDLVSSIVIEQERPLPTRYTGRITVVFNPNRVRAALGGSAVVPGATPPPVAAATPASNWVEAVATYNSMGEWLELQRRLRGASPIASVDILAIAVDAARLRVGLRSPATIAANDLATLGVALEPAAGPPGLSWHLGLARGG